MRFVLPLLVFAACGAPTPEAPKAKPAPVEAKADAKAAATPAPAPNLPGLKVDTASSKIEAIGAKVVGKHPILFKQFDGALELDGENLKAAAFVVQMASLESDDPKLTDHLKNADFFDVAAFPTAAFKSTSVVAKPGENGATHEITGEFEIHGQKKTLTFPAKVAVTPAGVQADASFVIDRRDFGVTYPGMKDNLIQDNVQMTISLKAPRS
jgi:polyisoprenoid-binding protein YceI